MTTNGEASGIESSNEEAKSSFQAIDRTKEPPSIDLPDELWMTVLESPCTFPPDIFATVMLNLIKNPNITSSHLFRADIFYDSLHDHKNSAKLVDHLKAEYRPLPYVIPGFASTRTIVRQMVPRNPQLDKPLIQTCHFFSRDADDSRAEENIVVYLPHVHDVSALPFYHPAVARLAFTHTWPPSSTNACISLSYSLFPCTTLTPKLSRTALRLLQTVHKHGQGQLRGYAKRVHLDRILPQKRYQDTYARLKAAHGRALSEQWVEVTDPGKHVFEDIAIAAYLVELWRDLYAFPAEQGGGDAEDKPLFPGFVDIGCGNGVLTAILRAEGYAGCGLDARVRKTWAVFPPATQANLQRKLLVPCVFPQPEEEEDETRQGEEKGLWHDGLFHPFPGAGAGPGAFIISNHADELTAWTPLLAHLNAAAFIAIPCCSHDLAGSRFRAPLQRRAQPDGTLVDKQAAETGSLARGDKRPPTPSAYATLCAYVARLAEEVGFEAEEDVLRIPSTRNTCIVGRRKRKGWGEEEGLEERKARVRDVVERELGRGVDAVGREWMERAEKLARKPGSGH